MEAFFSSRVGIAILLGVALVGLLVKLFSDIKINKLLRQTTNMGETKDRQLKQWKFKFENTYRMNRGMNNALVYIKKNFSQYRVWGIPIERLDRVNVTLAGVVVLIAFAFAALTVWKSMSAAVTVMYCFEGVLLAGVMLLWERGCSTSEKKEYIINNLQDFYENTLVSRLELGNELKSSETGVKPVEVLQPENKKIKKYAPIQETVHSEESAVGRRVFRDAVDEIKESRRVLSGTEIKKDIRTENFSKENRFASEGVTGTGQRINSEKMRKDVEYLKQSLDRIAAGREPEYVRPTRKLTEKEEKLIEEFIKEYL